MLHEVVAALIFQREKILLGKRSPKRKYIPNVWDVFGGHVEPGEGHPQTLIRELEEELGIKPTEWKYLETLTLSYSGTVNEPSEEWTTHLYLIRAWAGIPTNRQPEEHSAIGWFSLEEAKQLSLADPIYPTLFTRYLPAEYKSNYYLSGGTSSYNPVMPKLVKIYALLLLTLSGCLVQSQQMSPPPPSITFTQTALPPTPTSTLRFTPSPTETVTSTPEPFGCVKPPDDYTRIEVDGWTLNLRTFAMLANAQQLYGGELEITGYAITQGSYNSSVEASFGTHSGGGAVDLSVLQRGTYTVLWDDIEPLIRALRAAGFAAWLREYGELHPDSPIHIHAIAIGDQELSHAAQQQLTGEAGYFRGYSGLPVAMYGPPTPDRYGGPVLCQWMLDMGYQDMR